MGDYQCEDIGDEDDIAVEDLCGSLGARPN